MQARYLDSCMRSVLDQGYPHLDYILMDGGSSDASPDIIRRHQHRLAWWTSQRDGGQTNALIEGFKRASGEILGWLCSDDILLPGSLEFVGRYFAAHPDVDVIYGDALWIDKDGSMIRPKREMAFNRFVFLHDHNFVPQPSTFWRRSLYDQVGGLDSRFNFGMDGDLWERFSRHSELTHVSRYLACMRCYAEQKTAAQRPASLREGDAIRARYFFGSSPVFRPLAKAVARPLRILLKGINGGYGASVPHDLVASLDQYRTPG